jgi:hypothetical protein
MNSLRYEVKMTCSDLELPQVRAWVNMHPEAFIVTYPARRVNSLYFDTYEVGFLNDKLVGTSERAKLRFRWYGEDYHHVRGHLELKGKINRLGWKRRHPISGTFDLTTISWRALIDEVRRQASGPFGVWMSAAEQPTLINGYRREYYESRDHQVRLTIDYNLVAYEQIMYRTPNLVLRAPVPSQTVVEVKADPALHRRVSKILSSFPLQVTRNSKYVNGVIDSLCFT